MGYFGFLRDWGERLIQIAYGRSSPLRGAYGVHNAGAFCRTGGLTFTRARHHAQQCTADVGKVSEVPNPELRDYRAPKSLENTDKTKQFNEINVDGKFRGTL